MGVRERGTARTLNQWLKRTILKINFSQPMSCCLSPKPLETCRSSTLDELVRFCQRFGVQWIRLTLECATNPSFFDCISIFIIRSPYSEKKYRTA